MSKTFTPDKKKITILSSVLLFLGIASAFILNNINNDLRSRASNTPKILPVSRIAAVFEKPFFVELAFDPASGNQWQADFDTKIVKLNKVSFRQKDSKDGAETTEVQIFEFQPLEKGSTKIGFRYTKPMDPDTPPADTRSFDVTIN